MRFEIPEQKKLVHEMRMPIRWGDMDAMGHVNNTLYFRYMEVIRIEWLHGVGGPPDMNGEGFVIGITKRHHFCRRPLAQHFERFGHHGTFDTTTTHRADHFAVFVHGHCCARVAWA